MKTKTLVLLVPILAVMLTVLAVALSLCFADTAYASDGMEVAIGAGLETIQIVGIAIGVGLAVGLIGIGIASGVNSANKSKKAKEAEKQAKAEEERKKAEQAAAKKAAQEKKEAAKKAAEEKKKEEARKKAEARRQEEEARRAAIEEATAVANEPEEKEEPVQDAPVEEKEPVYEGEDVVPEEEKADVEEIIKEASQVQVTKAIINKKFVYEHIENAEYADKAQVNKRPNYNSANFPVPDTHYACGDEDKCFIYVYETKNPTVLLIYNTPEYAAELKKEHEYVAESKVPRSNDTWFKLIMDDSFTEDQVRKIIDDSW